MPTLLRHSKSTTHSKLRVKPGNLPLPRWQTTRLSIENEDHQPLTCMAGRTLFLELEVTSLQTTDQAT